jgi:hypothetical protein
MELSDLKISLQGCTSINITERYDNSIKVSMVINHIQKPTAVLTAALLAPSVIMSGYSTHIEPNNLTRTPKIPKTHRPISRSPKGKKKKTIHQNQENPSKRERKGARPSISTQQPQPAPQPSQPSSPLAPAQPSQTQQNYS